MKMFLMSLVLGAIPPWVATTTACAKEKKCEDKIHVIAVADSRAAAKGGPTALTLGGAIALASDGKKGKPHAFMIRVGKGADDGRSEHGGHKMTKWVRFGDGGGRRGYLGVSIANVPGALAAQLDIEGKGVMVRNVIEDSAADRAGLEKHDVILVIDGEEIGEDVRQAVRLIKSHKPGDEVEIIVLRNGKKREITITLDTRPRGDVKFDWKFNFAPDAEVEDRVRTFGRIMRRDDEGHWVMEDLGDLTMLKELPGRLRMFMPKSGNRTVQIFSEDGHKRIKTKVERDGTVIVVEQNDDEIKVSRVDEDGHETEATYASRDELREADEEAFDLLESSGRSIGIHLDLKGIDKAISGLDLDALDDVDFRFGHKFNFDREEWKEHLGEWREHLEESLEAARDARASVMEEVHELMERLWKDTTPPSGAKIKALPKRLLEGPGFKGLPGLRSLRHIHEPRHSFTVGTDGTIKVRIRRGDSELVQRFENADDLESRNPRLFKKYERLMDAGE